MHAIEMKHFNNCLYFYCINNGINFSIIVVNLNQMPPIVAKGQNYVNLPEKLWNKIKQMEEHKRAMLFKNH